MHLALAGGVGQSLLPPIAACLARAPHIPHHALGSLLSLRQRDR